MNRGKDDEKITGPMFPRLHVNDADKGGGPRAPPRNKMALYEQLSIPSQRYNSGANPTSNTNLAASGSSSQGVGPDRNLAFPHHKPPSTSANLAEKSHYRNSDRTNTNILLAQVEQRKKVADVDDFTVPVFAQSGNSHQSNTHNGVDKEKLVPLSTTYSGHVIKPLVNRYPKKTSDIHPSSRQQSEGVSKASFSNIDHFMETTSKLMSEKTDVSTGQKHSADHRFKPTRFQKIQKDSDSLPEIATRCDANESTRVIEEAGVPQSRTGSRLGGGYYSGRSNNEIEHHGEKTRETSQLGNQDNGDDLSETSVVDSISGLDISPDDVVGIIGQKHFWKARKAISTQQRVFAVQVFELHRLIKVQQLIAGSPNLTIESSAYPGKPTLNSTLANNISTEYIVKPLPQTIKQNDDSEKPNQKIECSAENAVGKKSVSVERNNNQPSTHGPYPGPTPQPPIAADPRMAPWLNQSPGQGQQWLVPVMSPSEGLIYKPYGGPGFPGAFCGGGGCGPFGPTPMPGNFMNLGYGIPPNHHPGFGHGYFNPYGMPIMMNPGIPSSEQTNQFPTPGPHSQAEHISGPGANSNFRMQNQSSCNMPSQKNDSVSRSQKTQGSKDTERQGSIASSLGERMQGETAGPSNDAPVVVDEVPRGQPARVIKVVPRNPRLATESAARIFRSIQKERAN